MPNSFGAFLPARCLGGFCRQEVSSSGVVIGEAAQNSARAVDREPDARETGRGRSSFWSYTHTECDVSLIIDQRELAEFPPGAVLGEPTCWRAVKLCGRRFEFDETGVVSAMFAPHKERVPMLNVSTFSNNLTLVEDENLDRQTSSPKLGEHKTTQHCGFDNCVTYFHHI